ncbi:Type 1 glutamine amidotransferase-like domain-containing protein [Streptomyces sp. NPDC004680]|uniref:Type 1 glutamine amidotransferase-like domain-containing protein n=1 Tax=unclassified Streptomyces TaxID=2593676 RepID=UPI0033A77C14
MELLLLSNSTAYGRTYLDHAMDPISEILNGTKEVLFVPFALADHAGYTAPATEALSPLDRVLCGEPDQALVAPGGRESEKVPGSGGDGAHGGG